MKHDYSKLSEQERREALAIAEELERRRRGDKNDVDDSQYIPQKPHPKQREFLECEAKEVLYGGAAGGGKSSSILMAALQPVHIKGYSAIIFRKTFQDLSLPDALIPRSHEWLGGSDARWDSVNHTWVFPSGAKLAFGYMDAALDMYRYQGAAFSFIGFDELTHFTEEKYLYMFSRLRTTQSVDVPLRMRATANPGGVGHRWVKKRFVDPRTRAAGAKYIPAKLADNPSLRADYADSLNYLDDVTKAQYLNGDWTVMDDNRFVYADFDVDKHVAEPPSDLAKDYRQVICGVDPGLRDPYAVTVIAQDMDGVWWVVEEFYKTGGSTDRWLPEFKAIQAKWSPRKWYVDKRRPSDILDLRSAKLKAVANVDIHGENERDTIRPMIGVVQDLLSSGRLKIAPSCKNAIREFENYIYREAGDRNAGEVPIDKDQHALDAIRYACCSVEEITSDRRQRKRGGGDMMPRPVGSRGMREKKSVVKVTHADYIRAQEARMDAAEKGRGRRRGW